MKYFLGIVCFLLSHSTWALALKWKSIDIAGCVYEDLYIQSENLNNAQLEVLYSEAKKFTQKKDFCQSAQKWSLIRKNNSAFFNKKNGVEQLILNLIYGKFYFSAAREISENLNENLPLRQQSINDSELNQEKLTFYLLKVLSFLIPQPNQCMVSIINNDDPSVLCQNGMDGAAELGSLLDIFNKDFKNSIFQNEVQNIQKKYETYVFLSEWAILKTKIRQYEAKNCQTSWFQQDCYKNIQDKVNRAESLANRFSELTQWIEHTHYIKTKSILIDELNDFEQAQLKYAKNYNNY